MSERPRRETNLSLESGSQFGAFAGVFRGFASLGCALHGGHVAVAIRGFHQGGKMRREVRMEGSGGVAPGPVAEAGGGGVHAGFAAEVEDVLEGKDADVGDGVCGAADHGPVDLGGSADRTEVDLGGGLLVLGGIVHPPAEGGVVVVGAGIGDGVRDHAVREIEVAATVCETELEDTHAGHAVVLAEFVDLLGDDTEIFGDERKIAEDIAETLEEVMAGGFDPLAVDGGLFVGGDGPVGLEAAEVIEADDVVEGEGAANAGDPPVEAVVFEDVPAVEGIAPALAGGGEVVWGDAGDAEGAEVGVELEDAGRRPDVGGVVVNEDGDVAEDAGSCVLQP